MAGRPSGAPLLATSAVTVAAEEDLLGHRGDVDAVLGEDVADGQAA